jgi:hypothetical protein
MRGGPKPPCRAPLAGRRFARNAERRPAPRAGAMAPTPCRALHSVVLGTGRMRCAGGNDQPARAFGTENAPLERFRGAKSAAVPYPCSVLTP